MARALETVAIKKTVEGTMDRQQRFWQKIVDRRQSMALSLDRARLVTSSYKETEGLPWVIRKARGLEKILAEIPIFIEEEDLLAGNQGSKLMCLEWNVEHDSSWVLREAERGDLWKHYPVRKEDIPEIKEICEFWKSRSRHETYSKWLDQLGLGEEARALGETEEGTWALFLFSSAGISGGHQVPDYPTYLKKGLEVRLAEIEAELQEAMQYGDYPSYRKINFLRALTITLRAAMNHARRYAALARELARKAQGERKAELERLAEICERVPAKPARSFYEALQMMWFYRVVEKWEGSYPNIPPARMDQYLYPYYRQDLEKGVLTPEEALELLECYRVKLSTDYQFLEGSRRELTSQAQYLPITLGGQNARGDDMTNELSYLILEAGFKLKTPHPNLAVRVHEKIPQDFYLRALELASLGRGYPAFYNDDSYIPWLLDFGVPLEDARNWCITGCVHPGVPGKNGIDGYFWVCTAKALELAMHNGVDPLTGKKIGVETGRFEDFKTYDEVSEAFKKQLTHLSERGAYIHNLSTPHYSEVDPVVFSSSFVNDCVKRGQSCSQAGGAIYGYNLLIPAGFMDVVDSLMAIKKCVFEDGSMSPGELKEALAVNFEGKEKIRRLLLAAPKFGNDLDEVDLIARDLHSWWVEMIKKMKGPFGNKWVSAIYTVGVHGAFGHRVGALPSGRLAGMPLADGGASPCQGADTHGPTAVVNSVGKIDWVPHFCNVHNMKFHPLALKSKEDLGKLGVLIKTAFDYGSKHLQVNVIDRDTLVDAQQHPEQYRDLVVRVAGYSAFFVELERNIQEDIIRRTEHQVA